MGANDKILIVEDNNDTMAIIATRLEISNYTVIKAKDGQEAVDKIHAEDPDLVILDLMIPKITGFEVCRMIRAEEKYRNMPIIVLSALDQEQDREKAIRSGADAYFIKPFDLKLLLEQIKNMLG